MTVTISEMNFSAEDLEEDDAAAVTVWTMSWTLRVEGGMRRSLVKVRAIPPVAKMELSQHIFEAEYRAPGVITHNAPANGGSFRHCERNLVCKRSVKKWGIQDYGDRFGR